MIIWLNGALLANDAARLDPADRGFTLGDGVFETLRISAGHPVHVDRHLDRMRNGLRVLAIPMTWRDAELASALAETARANACQNGSARLTVSRGPAPRGLLPGAVTAPTVTIMLGALPDRAPKRLVIGQSTCRNPASPLCRIKSLNYLDSVLARLEAAAAGADDAVLLNTQGRVAEASAANLFGWWGTVLATPPVTDGALPGIMRQHLLAAGAVEQPILPADLRRADELFLSSSLGLVSVSSLDGRPVGRQAGRLVSLAARIGALPPG